MLFVLLFAMSIFSGCTSPPPHRADSEVVKTPTIEMQSFLIQPQHLDMGSVMEGEEAQATLFVRNTGLLPLHIAEVYSECGCTVGSVASQEVPPGGFTTLDVRIDTTAKGEDIVKKITVIDLLGNKEEAWLTLRVKENPHAGDMSGRGIFSGKCAACHVVPAAGKVKGEDIYAAVCAMCHGVEGRGAYAPKLRGQDVDALRLILQHGIDRRMPAFSREKGGPLSPHQIVELTNWLSGLDE